MIALFMFVQVQRLLDLCPTPSANGIYRITKRCQDALVALGIYFIESGLQHKQKILPYLTQLYKCLPRCQWSSAIGTLESKMIVVLKTGRFHFHKLLMCVSTLLKSVSSLCPHRNITG